MVQKNAAWLVILLPILFGAYIVRIYLLDDQKQIGKPEFTPVVFLTVSSLAFRSKNGSVVQRQLELNWLSSELNNDSQSWVGLFPRDPNEGIHEPLVAVKTKKYPNGYFRTSVMFPRPIFLKDELRDMCLGFWIAYVHHKTVLSTSCIRARPHWMYELRNKIGNKTLAEIMIPGTHDSGTYFPYKPDKDNLFIKYLVTQEEDIWTQLVYGNRYLDIRVAYQVRHKSKEIFWICHGIFDRDVSLKNVFVQIRNFINVTNEIVILDFHRIENGFDGPDKEQRHAELIRFIEAEFSDIMVPLHVGSNATLNDLWKSGKRLFVGYAYNERKQSSLLNPGIMQLWANTDKIEDLENYFQEKICLPKTYISSAMAELTPTHMGTLLNLYGGLRKLAQSVNSNVTRWFRDKWSTCSNIIATDFFLGNDITNIAIEFNSNLDSN